MNYFLLKRIHSLHIRNKGISLFFAAILTFSFLSCGGVGPKPPSSDSPKEKGFVTVSDIYNKGATVTWPGPSQDEEVLSYTIRFIPADGGDPVEIIVNTDEVEANEDGSLSWDITGLSEETEYTVQVIPKTAKGDIQPIGTEEEESVNTNLATHPESPRDLTAVILDVDSSISITWTAPEDPGTLASGQPAGIASYVLYWTYGTISDFKVSADLFTTLEDWEGGTDYTFYVLALNDQGLTGSLAGPVVVTTPSQASPIGTVSPEFIVYTAQANDGFTITWDPVVPAKAPSGKILPVSYQVYLGDSETDTLEGLVVKENLQDDPNTSDTSFTASGLSAATTYNMLIKAVAGDEDSFTLSGVFPVFTANPSNFSTKPSVPTNLAKDLNHKYLGHIRVTWDASTDGHGIIESSTAATKYRVFYRKAGEIRWIAWGFGPSAHNYEVLVGLEGGTNYEIKVLAINSEDNSKSSVSTPLTVRSNGFISLAILNDGASIPGDTITLNSTRSNLQLTADLDLENYDGEQTFLWTSSNESTAVVDNTGVVTPWGVGETTITVVWIEDHTESASITLVIDMPLLNQQGLTFSYNLDQSVDEGIAKTYDVTVSPSDFSSKEDFQYNLKYVQKGNMVIDNPGFSLDADSGSFHFPDTLSQGVFEVFISIDHPDYAGLINMTLTVTINQTEEGS